MVWADILKILVAGGILSVVGTVIVAFVNGVFGRSSTKATAAKLVTEQTKLAQDMVREISEDLRKDNDDLRAIVANQTELIKALNLKVDRLTERLWAVSQATKTAIPMIALHDPAHAELLTDLLSEHPAA